MIKDYELKKRIIEKAEKTSEPEQVMSLLYAQNNLTPAMHINPLTNHEFTGKNIWKLEKAMIENNFESCNWSTFAQYKQNKKHIKKGSHGFFITLAVFKKNKEEETEDLQFFKGYRVFNEMQTA